MTDNTIRKSLYLKASRVDIWNHLTQPELMKSWFHVPKAELTMGEPYEMVGRDSGEKLCWGRVRDAQPYERLEYTFSIAQTEGVKSKVIWTLKEVETITRLSLVHSGLPRKAENMGLTVALDKGWDDHIAELRVALDA